MRRYEPIDAYHGNRLMRLTCVLKNAVILGAVNLWTKLVVERLVAGIAEKTATWIPLK